MLEKMLSRKLCKLDLSLLVVILMVIIYSAVFSYYTIMKHYSFRSYTWDLGIIVQSISSATKGKLFTNNAELFYSPTGSYFGVHFTPILFVLIPFFYIAPRVETVLIIQSIILGLGAIPLYFISDHLLEDKLSSMLLAISYLLNPSIHGVNWYDFHTQSFFPLFVLATTYFLKKKRIILFLIFIIMTLMTMEQAAYFLILYLPYVGLQFKSKLKELFFYRKPSIESLTPFITLIVIVIWIYISGNMISALNPNPPKELKALDHYRILEIKDPIEIPIKAITNFDLVLKAMGFDLPSKILYIIITFAPTCFISLMSPLPILPAVLWLFLSALSNYPPYYQLGFQYSAFTIPFIYIGTVESLKYIWGEFNKEHLNRILSKISIIILIVCSVLSMLASPLSFIFRPGEFSYFRDYGISIPSRLDIILINVLKGIPDDATILVTATIFPHLSTNPNAYTIPPINTPSKDLFENNFRYLKGIKYDYILLSSFWDKEEANLIYENFIKGKDEFGMFIMGPGLELYKRNYEGPVIKFAIKFSYKELFLGDSSIVDDPSSESGKVIMLKESSISNRYAWFGPYITLNPGNYTVNFRIKINKILEGKIMKLDVWSNSLKNAIGSVEILGENFSRPFVWHTFTLKINILTRVPDVEFRGLEVSKDVSIWLDYVEVIPR
jgi:uncharacterized membrane protein